MPALARAAEGGRWASSRKAMSPRMLPVGRDCGATAPKWHYILGPPHDLDKGSRAIRHRVARFEGRESGVSRPRAARPPRRRRRLGGRPARPAEDGCRRDGPRCVGPDDGRARLRRAGRPPGLAAARAGRGVRQQPLRRVRPGDSAHGPVADRAALNPLVSTGRTATRHQPESPGARCQPGHMARDSPGAAPAPPRGVLV
jgi:hypothetical protein